MTGTRKEVARKQIGQVAIDRGGASRSRRVRVLFFDHTATMSGGEIALLNLVRHIDQELFEPIVVLASDGPLVSKLQLHASVHVIPMRRDVLHARKDSLGAGSLLKLVAAFHACHYIGKLSKFIRRNDIRIVCTNSLKADVLGGLAARFARRPVAWYVRDRIAPDYLPASMVKLFRWLAGWLPNAIIVNSHATAATLKSAALRTPLYVVHDGVPAPAFHTRSSDLRSDSPKSHLTNVGIVGRLSPWKGQDVFLRAAHLVREKHPAVNFRIIGAALFEEVDYEMEIRTLATSLLLEDAVEFRGFCDNVTEEMAQLDVFVHASTRPEPFGQVLIEAMAAGVPVIATDAGGVPEIVQDGLNGLLVPMNDPEALAAAICSLIDDPTLAKALSRRGGEAVRSKFSIQKTAGEVGAILRTMIDEDYVADHAKQPANGAAADQEQLA